MTASSSSPGADTYLALPETPNGAGILVLHAWWGLTPFFRSCCDRLAQQGFVALAPDLYQGKTVSTVEDAERMADTLNAETLMQEIQQGATQLRSHALVHKTAIGVVGFSLGAFWGLWLAQQPEAQVGATAAFYGLRNGDDYSASPSAFQFHLAESDEFEPTSEVNRQQESLEAAGKEAEFFIYPGTTHWFFEPDVPTAYNPEAANLAWERTLAFLHGHL